MQEVSFEREVRAEPVRVLQRLEKALTALGYSVATRSNDELNFVGAGTGGRHRLSVRADGQTVRFAFVPGAPGAALPERDELERRVEAALQDFSGAPASGAAKPASSSGRRCSICATPLEAGARHCPMCGMPQP